MKHIILFYSFGGNTKKVAEFIQHELKADMAEITTVKPYTGSYNSVVDQGQREVNCGYMPEIRPVDVDMSQYDRVLLGTPVWWYTFAPAMKTFLHNCDLSGKKVYPFATNGGWIGHTFKDFSEACRGAEVYPGLNIRFNEDQQLTSESDVIKWLKRIGEVGR